MTAPKVTISVCIVCPCGAYWHEGDAVPGKCAQPLEHAIKARRVFAVAEKAKRAAVDAITEDSDRAN